jgi:hypothetical protein
MTIRAWRVSQPRSAIGPWTAAAMGRLKSSWIDALTPAAMYGVGGAMEQ